MSESDIRTHKVLYRPGEDDYVLTAPGGSVQDHPPGDLRETFKGRPLMMYGVTPADQRLYGFRVGDGTYISRWICDEGHVLTYFTSGRVSILRVIHSAIKSFPDEFPHGVVYEVCSLRRGRRHDVSFKLTKEESGKINIEWIEGGPKIPEEADLLTLERGALDPSSPKQEPAPEMLPHQRAWLSVRLCAYCAVDYGDAVEDCPVRRLRALVNAETEEERQRHILAVCKWHTENEFEKLARERGISPVKTEDEDAS